jgi:hypothetical protein
VHVPSLINVQIQTKDALLRCILPFFHLRRLDMTNTCVTGQLFFRRVIKMSSGKSEPDVRTMYKIYILSFGST